MSSAIPNDVAFERTSADARPAAVFAVAAALALLYLGAGVFDHGIWSPTEPAVAGVVWNMSEGSGLAVPRINEMAYLEKPPLYYWLSLLATKVLGLGAPALRLPSVLFGLGALAVLWFTVRRHFGPDVATLAVPIVGTFFSFWEVTHRASTDAGVLFFSFLAYSVFLSGPDGAPRPGRLRLDRDVALAAVLAVSFLVKNLFVPFVVLVPVTATLAVLGEWRRLARVWALSGAGLLLVVLPWGIVLWAEGGPRFVEIAFFENTVGRFLDLERSMQCDAVVLNDARVVERQGPLFYVLPLLVLTLPWSALVLPSVWRAARETGRSTVRTFLVVGFASAAVALSLSASKVVEYLLPLYFFLGLAAAEWLRRELGGEQRRTGFLVGHVRLLTGLFAGVAVVLCVRGGGEPRAVGAAALAAASFVLSLALPRSRGSFAAALSLVVLAEAAALGALVPEADRRKTPEPFFRLVRPAIAGRAVVTDTRDDRLLPLINFYLGQRVKVLGGKADVVSALSGPRPVAAIVRADFEKGLGPFPRGLKLQRLQASEGKRGLVCLLNLP